MNIETLSFKEDSTTNRPWELCLYVMEIYDLGPFERYIDMSRIYNKENYASMAIRSLPYQMEDCHHFTEGKGERKLIFSSHYNILVPN